MRILTLYHISQIHSEPLECKVQIWSRRAGKDIRVIDKLVVPYNVMTISPSDQYKRIRGEWEFCRSDLALSIGIR